jgi:broad specificity phosphatase PhoE
MTTRIYLIRHGATELTAEDRQAGLLAQRLADDAIKAVYCSPMKRTQETASIIAAPHGLFPIFKEGLKEINHGHWETMRRAEVEKKFAAEYADWQEDPFTFAPAGGESGVSVIARALPVIREIVTTHPDENVVVVSHKATIRLLVSSLLGFDARGYRDRLDQLPACLNILDFKDAVHARLMLFNDISHYTDHPPRSSGRLSKVWSETDH